MTKNKDPNSNRSQKRAKRNFTASRPERRAERRLVYATASYEDACRVDKNGSKPYTLPGAIKHW